MKKQSEQISLFGCSSGQEACPLDAIVNCHDIDDMVYVSLAQGVFYGKIYKVLPKYPWGKDGSKTWYEVRGKEFVTITPNVWKEMPK